MDWRKAYYMLDFSMCKIQRHKTMVYLGNSSLWLEYRAQEEVDRHRLKRKADLSVKSRNVDLSSRP